jgi:PAT family beta-lactamase induction signal transducer AmpG
MQFPNLLESKWGRLTTFFFLYVTEGIPLGFTATAIGAQMRRQGVPPEKIGIFIGTLYLPWAWKWLVGPIVDNVYSEKLGRRRAWIVAMQVLMVAVLMTSMPINFSAQLALFTSLVFVINMCGATQDVAIDSLACNVLEEDERGLANGLMFGGQYIGQAVGGSGVLFLSTFIGFQSTFFFVAACILTVTVFIALPMRERKTPPKDLPKERGIRAAGLQIADYGKEAVRAFFGTRAAIAGLVFALLPCGAFAMSLGLATTLQVELGLTDRDIGVLSLICTLIAAVCCVVGGVFSDFFGRRLTLGVYIVGSTIPTLYMAWAMQQAGWIWAIDPTLPDRPVPPEGLVTAFWVASMVFSVFQGLMAGARTAMYMDICTPEVAATQFTAYMAMINLVTWYTSTWQGFAIRDLGYPKTLTIDAAAAVLCITMLPFMKPVKKERKETGGEG